MIIIDSTPLIHFNRAGLSWIFGEFETVISQAVYEEVVTQGKIKNKQDALTAEILVKNKTIKVEKVKNGLRKELESFGNLGKGEIETLCLTYEKKATAIIDETSARTIGKLFKIDVRGSFHLIFSLCSKRKLPVSKAKEVLNKLVESGWYCSPEVYKTILEKLDSIQ